MPLRRAFGFAVIGCGVFLFALAAKDMATGSWRAHDLQFWFEIMVGTLAVLRGILLLG